jgi:hypothetical protein
MNKYVDHRLKAIQQSLMAHYKGGIGMPSAVAGSERESFVNEYLSKILPPLYRFGRGTITDSQGKRAGQIDVVIEFPFSFSFPMPTGNERLYLAESVATVVEVKSNLSSQWDEVEKTVRKVKELARNWEIIQTLVPPEPERRIPCYAVGYTGYKTLRGLQKRLDSTHPKARPDGVLVVDSGCFMGFTCRAVGAWGLYGFASELLLLARSVLVACPDIFGYGNGMVVWDTGNTL